MSESDLYKPLLDYLEYRRIPAKRNQCGVVHVGKRWINLGAEGWPDIIGVLPDGRFLGIEVKTEGYVMSAVQRRRMGELVGQGASWWVVHDVAELAEKLKENGY